MVHLSMPSSLRLELIYSNKKKSTTKDWKRKSKKLDSSKKFQAKTQAKKENQVQKQVKVLKVPKSIEYRLESQDFQIKQVMIV